MSVDELVRESREHVSMVQSMGHFGVASKLVERLSDKLEELAAALRIAQGNTDAAIEDYNEAQAAIATAKRENEALRELVRWTYDTLYEINLSNYDHDEVCKLNYASVEVILGLSRYVGEQDSER